jgi:RNA polymerase sigma factor (sigma-70 family)
MMPYDPTLSGAEDVVIGSPESNTTRAKRQSDLVSRIMLARRAGDSVSERLLSGELLRSVRPVIKRVVKCIKPFAGTQSSDDLEQVASIAVLRTIAKYDPTRGGQSFGEVAYFRARTACAQFARMHASDVHLSDGDHKGRTLRSALGEQNAIRVESTETSAPERDEPPGHARGDMAFEAAFRALTNREESAESPEAAAMAAELRAQVFEAVRRLAPARRELISRLYGINRPAESVRSVAEAWGASKSRVDRMLARALAELHELLPEQDT